MESRVVEEKTESLIKTEAGTEQEVLPELCETAESSQPKGPFWLLPWTEKDRKQLFEASAAYARLHADVLAKAEEIKRREITFKQRLEMLVNSGFAVSAESRERHEKSVAAYLELLTEVAAEVQRDMFLYTMREQGLTKIDAALREHAYNKKLTEVTMHECSADAGQDDVETEPDSRQLAAIAEFMMRILMSGKTEPKRIKRDLDISHSRYIYGLEMQDRAIATAEILHKPKQAAKSVEV